MGELELELEQAASDISTVQCVEKGRRAHREGWGRHSKTKDKWNGRVAMEKVRGALRAEQRIRSMECSSVQAWDN